MLFLDPITLVNILTSICAFRTLAAHTHRHTQTHTHQQQSQMDNVTSEETVGTT